MIVRQTWYAVATMDSEVALVAEVREAFAPVRQWRSASPCERTNALWDDVLGTIPSLMLWGWDITTIHGQHGSWTVTASRSIEKRGSPVRATGRGVDLPDALVNLGTKLASAVGHLGDAPEDAAA